MRYKSEKIVEKIPVIVSNCTLYDIIDIFVKERVPVVGIGDKYITIDNIVKILVLNRENLHKILFRDVSPFTRKLSVFMKRTSFRNIISKLYGRNEKYMILKADKFNIIGAITPRSLFSYFSKYLLLNDLNYFYYKRFRCVVTPNTTIVGTLRKMNKYNSNFSPMIFKGKFRGIVSSYDIISYLIDEEVINKVNKRKNDYFFETSIADFCGYFVPVIDVMDLNVSKVRKILSKYSVLAIVRNNLLEYFVDDYNLIDYTRQKLIKRWFDEI